ncbi:CYTH domain protein [archaeon BMS3Abin16]|nr:CYTH domain protein [archaeon BMS3Abin16]
MLEIEVKARIDSIPAVEARILELGGEFRKEVIEVDVYYNHPNRDFAETDEAIRLRRVEDMVFLTYKGPKIDRHTKTREEFNLKVDSWDNSTSILRALGFTEVMPVKKRRRYLRLEEFEIMLDYLEGLGSFIEVEMKGDYKPDALFDFLRELGVEGSETRSYLELVLEKQGKLK